VQVIEFFQARTGFISFGRLATTIWRNQAQPSSRDATARPVRYASQLLIGLGRAPSHGASTLAFPSFNGKDRSPPLKGRLHDFRSIIMTNTFQFIRTIKPSWRFPNEREDTRIVRWAPGERLG
jgi:hypothetical protein